MFMKWARRSYLVGNMASELQLKRSREKTKKGTWFRSGENRPGFRQYCKSRSSKHFSSWIDEFHTLGA